MPTTPNTPHPALGRLTWSEVGRKLYHLLGLLIPLLYLYTDTSREFALFVLGGLWIIAVTFDVVRFSWQEFNRFALRYSFGILRADEERKLNGMVFYMLASFLVVLFWSRELAALSLIVLVVGDTFAALIGLAFGRIKLMGGKSLEGSLACLVSVFLICLLFLSPERAILAAVVATLVEALPTLALLNDNLLIPLATSGAIALSYSLW